MKKAACRIRSDCAGIRRRLCLEGPGKRKRKHLLHPALCNMIYYQGWAWLPLTPLQEEAYGKFENLVIEKTDLIEQLLIPFVGIFLWFIFAAGCFFAICNEWADYLSARRDFDTYRWEKMEQESKPGG